MWQLKFKSSMFSTLGSPNDLARMGKIPTKLSATYMELVAAKPDKRPTSRYVLIDSMTNAKEVRG